MNFRILNRPFAVGGILTSVFASLFPFGYVGEPTVNHNYTHETSRARFQAMVMCAIVGCRNRSDRNYSGKVVRHFYRLLGVITHQGSQMLKLSKSRQEAWLAMMK